MYTLPGYVEMARRDRRLKAYVDVLERRIERGRSTVLDLGSGLGIMAIHAAKLGARHVFAVEPDNVIHIAREIARDNGCSDRIDFIQCDSRELDLEAPVDIIVSDLRGVLPPLKRHIPTIIDARARLLSPDGRLVPVRDTVHACLVHDEDQYRRLVPSDKPQYAGLDLSAARRRLVNNWARASITPETVRSPDQALFTIDYRTVSCANFNGRAEWSLPAATTVNGLGLWFDARLDAQASYSNAPRFDELVYGRAFFPLTCQLSPAAGDRISIDLKASLVADDYVWTWTTTHRSADGALRRRFHQSTFHGEVFAPDELSDSAEDSTPSLTPLGQAELFILSRLDGNVSIADLARRARQRFPGVFGADRNRALEMVREIARRCC